MAAHTSESRSVSTCLGRLHVRQSGSGSPALLWHSLWVDSRSWGPLVDALSEQRRVVTVDGPGYGASSPIDHDFTLDDCAQAAIEVMAELGFTEPVDWVGNAWGGHVGLTLAASCPERLRSLVTIAAPLDPVGRRQRWTQSYPLALLYRLTGPNRIITKVLFDVLLSPEGIAAQPGRADEMVNAFKHADRESIRRTIRFMHHWQPLSDKTPTFSVPTLFITGDLGDQHWSPADARAAAQAMPNARAVALSAAGHVGPLLLNVDEISTAITDFWQSQR